MNIFSDNSKKIELLTIEDWLKHCPPVDKDKQWVDKRSAKEMANFWINTNNQNDFLNFIKQVNSSIEYKFACPEYATKFDDFRSPRKNDLCIFAKMDNKDLLIAIEGKSYEHFENKYLKDEWKGSINDKLKNNDSNKLDRIINLYFRFLKNSGFLSLRYQLVYWIAGVVDEAKRMDIDTIFLIVQEFHSDLTKKEKIIINKNDLNLLIELISDNKFRQVRTNEIIGPIDNKYTDGIKLYIGNYIVNLK